MERLTKAEIDSWENLDDVELYDALSKVLSNLKETVSKFKTETSKGLANINISKRIRNDDTDEDYVYDFEDDIKDSSVLLTSSTTLERTRYNLSKYDEITIGTDHLILHLDHKPLVKIPLLLVENLEFDVDGYIEKSIIDFNTIVRAFCRAKKNKTLSECHKLIGMIVNNQTPSIDLNSILNKESI